MIKLIKLNLILSDETLIGNGKDDPYRRPLKAFTEDGTCVFEYDSMKDNLSMTANLIATLQKFYEPNQ